MLLFLIGAGAASGIMQKTGKIGPLVPVGAACMTVGLGLLALLAPDTPYGEAVGFMVYFY